MNKIKKFLLILSVGLYILGLQSDAQAVSKQKPKEIKKEVKKVESKTEEKIKNEVKDCKTKVELFSLVKESNKWLNKEVCFEGEFTSFSDLALDYPKALRKHNEYISFLILRPKTEIPLSELKLAMKIKDVQNHESFTKIKEGDLVKIKGKVFSTALNEPWVDIIQIEVIPNKNAKTLKESSEVEEFY